MTSLVVITPPAVEPVTLAEVKTHARVDSEADDALISSLIAAARQWAETYTKRAFITQSLRLWMDTGPDGYCVELPRPPLMAVTAVQTFDDDGAAKTWAETNYFADTGREPGRLVLRLGAAWPVEDRYANNLAVDYTAGYGDGGDAVPEPIKLAIKQLAAHWYEHRGEAVIMPSSRHDAVANQGGVNVPFVIQTLLDPYRLRGIGH